MGRRIFEILRLFLFSGPEGRMKETKSEKLNFRMTPAEAQKVRAVRQRLGVRSYSEAMRQVLAALSVETVINVNLPEAGHATQSAQ
jgi:hypothetical protein